MRVNDDTLRQRSFGASLVLARVNEDFSTATTFTNHARNHFPAQPGAA